MKAHLAGPGGSDQHRGERGLLLRLRLLPGELRLLPPHPVDQIAEAAFASQHPASLGSRCTVFMNSSIVTEQRNGKQPGDIMAGLCRSIIENVFTKVIRVSNLDSLGDKIVVQGGQPSATTRCSGPWSSTTGKQVFRSPYPGLMGAIGAALITKDRMAGQKRTFIGLDALDSFSYTQEANSPCPFCGNHCKRTIVTFSNGRSWGHQQPLRAGRGAGRPQGRGGTGPAQGEGRPQGPDPRPLRPAAAAPLPDYPCPQLAPDRGTVIGIHGSCPSGIPCPSGTPSCARWASPSSSPA